MIAEANARREYFLRRAEALEIQHRDNGVLRRQDWSSLDYFKDPYLVEATTQSLHKRYQDLMGNLWVLDPSGKIAPLMDKNREIWNARIVHVQEELFARGLGPIKADEDVHVPNPTFPDTPPGIRILNGKQLPDPPYFVKIGHHSHMKALVEKGEIRIAPASSYFDPSLNTATKDNELELYASYSTTDIHKTKLGRLATTKINEKISSEITITRTLPDFYIYCLSYQYDHRLISDFRADTAVFIKDPNTFLDKLAKAVKKADESLVVRFGAIDYYDPYFVEDWDRSIDGFVKHFRYAYQREFRVCLNHPVVAANTLMPFFVNLGDMRSFTEIMTLN